MRLFNSSENMSVSPEESIINRFKQIVQKESDFNREAMEIAMGKFALRPGAVRRERAVSMTTLRAAYNDALYEEGQFATRSH